MTAYVAYSISDCWPLFRKGSKNCIVKSQKDQEATKWVWDYDDSLFEIWNQLLDDKFYEGILMLWARGRIKQEAVEYWIAAVPERRPERLFPTQSRHSHEE
jgi:hypothetical protein